MRLMLGAAAAVVSLSASCFAVVAHVRWRNQHPLELSLVGAIFEALDAGVPLDVDKEFMNRVFRSQEMLLRTRAVCGSTALAFCVAALFLLLRPRCS
jgi:hypothetical protein